MAKRLAWRRCCQASRTPAHMCKRRHSSQAECRWRTPRARACHQKRLLPAQSPRQWQTCGPAPMARFRFNIELAETSGMVQVRVATGYPFPRPVAVTGIAHGNRNSRWVSPGVWQPVLSISPPDPQELSWAVPAPASQVAWHHLQEGFVHILPKGLDHILFVVALLLAIQSLRLAVWLITGFTLAHSITLTLVATGSLNPPADWVEFAIAATILIVALENCWRSRPGSRWRWWCRPRGPSTRSLR